MAGDTSLLPGTQPDEPQSEPKPSAARRVLVVEDEIAIADLLVLLLEGDGFEVDVATDGRDALRVAMKFRPEVILLDIMLPGIDGFEVTRQLRYNATFAPHFGQVRILYLTAHHAILRQRFQALPDTPVSDWILKPFDIGELMGKVRRAFAERDALLANAEAEAARALSARLEIEKAHENSRGFLSKLQSRNPPEAQEAQDPHP